MNGNTATINVSLKQDQINQVFSQIDTQNEDTNFLLKKITGVELHNGYIRVLGTYTNSDGSEANGSYDVSLSAVNNMLKAQIIHVDVEGVNINDARIAQANQRISEELSKTVTDINGDVQFREAAVTEGALNLKVLVNLKVTVNP